MMVYRWTSHGLEPWPEGEEVLALRHEGEDWWGDTATRLRLTQILEVGEPFGSLRVEAWQRAEDEGVLLWLITGDENRLVWLSHWGEWLACLAWLTPLVRELRASGTSPAGPSRRQG